MIETQTRLAFDMDKPRNFEFGLWTHKILETETAQSPNSPFPHLI